MRDRLIELIWGIPFMSENNEPFMRGVAGEIADHLLANGVVLVDHNTVDFVTNIKPIQMAFGMPLDELADLIRAKQEERIIVPPCKVGDLVHFKGLDIPWKVSSIHFYAEGCPQISITSDSGKITTTMTIPEFEEFACVITEEGR